MIQNKILQYINNTPKSTPTQPSKTYLIRSPFNQNNRKCYPVQLTNIYSILTFLVTHTSQELLNSIEFQGRIIVNRVFPSIRV